ncbi:hypothetical protein BJ322DRAFT_1187034 [Thelephora terrestris]|uniref:Uncharacterized protein n=1 Tax=Thelephora terrestris TaxID=56493 RepID=A0A9P6L8K2_9AGAM|nr:hypothetical protein BJ322DRAFT_1187034 [Thelephora terrestris]
MLPQGFLLSSLFLLSCVLPPAYSNFTYQFSTLGSCDDVEVSWTGGQGPFGLLLVPLYGTPSTFQIPASAVNNGKGVYNASLNFPKDQQIFLVMSDATGLGSGGTSEILTVGSSVSGNSCNTTDPGSDFTFSSSDYLTQCETAVFSDYERAVQPITIVGFIPGGNLFQLNPPNGSTTYNWQADLEAGTSVVFVATDSKGRQGGATQITRVRNSNSNNSSCLGSTFPTSTPNMPTSTSPAKTSAPSANSSAPPANSSALSANSSTPSTVQSSKKNSGPNVVTLALASLGGVLALAIVAALIFYFQRRRKRDSAYSEGSDPHRGKRGPRRLSLDPEEEEEPRPFDHALDDQVVSFITPFPDTQSATSSDHLRHSREDSRDPLLGSPRSGLSPSSRRPKLPSSPSRQLRYVVHTDVEDAMPEHGEEEVIELPPMYSGRRGPVSPSEHPTISQ